MWQGVSRQPPADCAIDARLRRLERLRMAATTMSAAGAATTPMRPRGRSETGLSIVVPVFNEAGGLAALARPHRRDRRAAEGALAADHRGRLCRRRQPRRHARRRRTRLPADALDVQVVSLSRNFGKEAALLAGLDHARFGAVLFMDGDGQHPPTLVETLVGHWLDDGYDVVYTAKAQPRERAAAAPAVGARLLRAAQLGRAPQDPGGRRRLPPALAARRRRAQADAGAQPLLQRPGELDRLPPDPRRLRAGRRAAMARPPGTCSR